MTTLRQIAKEAGVHVATASAVLNAAGGNTRVGEETRRKVLEVARQLSYVPNESARRLRTGRSNVVGFLGGDLRNPFFSELAAALEAELAPRNLQLMVSHVAHSEPARVQDTIKRLQQQGVSGIAFWEESASSVLLAEVASDRILSIGFTATERPGVWLDLESAIQVAIQEMTRRGFLRLGFFLPRSQVESPSVAARSSAFLSLCKKQKLARPVLAFYEGESWDLAAAAEEGERAWKAHPEVDAWVGFNDVAGLGLLSNPPRKAHSRVLCFDGTAMARYWPGRPPCLDLKIAALAKRVAAVLAREQSAAISGRRKNWILPTLGG